MNTSKVSQVNCCCEHSFPWIMVHRGNPVPAGKTKTEIHPLYLMQMSLASHWCCSRLKLLEQAQIFSACRTITLPGFCINHKAINKNKHIKLRKLRKKFPWAKRKKEVKEVKSPPADLRIAAVYIMFIALKRMTAFCKKVVLGFRFGR